MSNKLRTLHKISLYVVLTLAFSTLVAGGGVSYLLIGVFTVAAVTSWFLIETDWPEDVSNTWWNLAILGFFGYTAVDLLASDDPSYLLSGIDFVVVLTSIKMLSNTGERDELQLYGLSFLTVASATAVNEDVTFGILFALYVLAGTFSLALFHLKHEDANRRTVSLTSKFPFDGRYAAVLSAISVVIFISSLGIFFGFPRIGLGYFAQNSRAGVSMGGFSDEVQLGDHGTVRDNPEVVMRVEFPDDDGDDEPASRPPPNFQTLHWRTITFDRYDGTSWSRTAADETSHLRYHDEGYDFSKAYGPAINEQHGEPTDIPSTAKIYLEPLDGDLLPTLWPTRRLKLEGAPGAHLPGSPRSGDVKMNLYGDVQHTVESDMGIPYRLVLYPRPDEAQLADNDGPLPKEGRVAKMFLQTPDISGRVERLARDVTSGADTPFRKAKALERHLRTNYAYTTDLPKVADGDAPLEYFLFESQRGHCEYYATAMVMMLRTLGIPARMVNGFLGGQWNDVGSYLAVRQGDAHSWVEVYVPNFGWHPLDPTPEGVANPQELGIMTWGREMYDSMRMTWMKWVIEYDLETQIDLVKQAWSHLAPHDSFDNGDRSNRQSEGQEETADDPTSYLIWGGLILLGTIAALLLWRYLRTRRALPRISRLFAKIERAGKKAGYPRNPDEGPEAYLDRLSDEFPEASRELQIFKHRYLQVRFGGRELSEEMLGRLEEIVRKIVRSG